ncbi:hypothetical protein DPMN_184198 [Dreissena polymorpha]|uniref:Uncharacterized protein n=1 Tax=Dreissena polymorpha TaxID=45954 RepID=A0A9D4DKF2_DREPO|nr:hypothetical protein DPMN_184198 [Dreissena polymorpha]
MLWSARFTPISKHTVLANSMLTFSVTTVAAKIKTNYIVIWYLLWRVLVGLHRNITLSFMLVGHTKFTPDWHFGILKSKWRTGHNIPQLVGDTSNPVVFYDWKDYLSTLFHHIKNVTKFHQFHVSADHPGVVECREFSDSSGVLRKVSKVNVNVSCDDLPKEMFAKGLDLDRQWYHLNLFVNSVAQMKPKTLHVRNPLLFSVWQGPHGAVQGSQKRLQLHRGDYTLQNSYNG